MSQRDLIAELQAARVAAPAEVREQVRLIVASAEPPRRRLTWRRAAVLALPIAAAVAGTIVAVHPFRHATAAAPPPITDLARKSAAPSIGATAQGQTGATVPNAAGAGAATLAPQASPTRAQTYGAYLALRLRNANGVSDGVKQALRITSSLGGYPTSVHASSGGPAASADLVLRVPRARVQEAISRLSALGSITAEQVDVQDIQAGLDATGRTIARLQRRLVALRAQPQTPAVARSIEAITARVARLQRQEAAALRTARLATIRLHLATPTPPPAPAHHGHGPLHGLGVAFRWIGIGAVYALALGAPLLALIGLGWLGVRTLRRRREDALLSRI